MAFASVTGRTHASDLREARRRQLALIAIAIAAGNATAPRPAAAAALPEKAEEPLSEEQQRTRAQIRRLGICRPADPDSPAMDLERPAQTAP